MQKRWSNCFKIIFKPPEKVFQLPEEYRAILPDGSFCWWVRKLEIWTRMEFSIPYTLGRCEGSHCRCLGTMHLKVIHLKQFWFELSLKKQYLESCLTPFLPWPVEFFIQKLFSRIVLPFILMHMLYLYNFAAKILG